MVIYCNHLAAIDRQEKTGSKDEMRDKGQGKTGKEDTRHKPMQLLSEREADELARHGEIQTWSPDRTAIPSAILFGNEKDDMETRVLDFPPTLRSVSPFTSDREADKNQFASQRQAEVHQKHVEENVFWKRETNSSIMEKYFDQ